MRALLPWAAAIAFLATWAGAQTKRGTEFPVPEVYVEEFAGGSVTGGLAEAVARAQGTGVPVVRLRPGLTEFKSGWETVVIPRGVSIVGYGRRACEEPHTPAACSGGEGGGSAIVVTSPAASAIPAIRVQDADPGQGARLRGFTVRFQGAASNHANNIGIDLGGAGDTDGINEWVLEDVLVLNASTAATGDRVGVGIRTNFALKGEVWGGEIRGFGTGVLVQGAGGLQGNANSFYGTSIRANKVGVDVTLCNDVYIHGATIEANNRGVWGRSSTGPCHIVITASHLENGNAGNGATHNENVHLSTGAMILTSVGNFYTNLTASSPNPKGINIQFASTIASIGDTFSSGLALSIDNGDAICAQLIAPVFVGASVNGRQGTYVNGVWLARSGTRLYAETDGDCLKEAGEEFIDNP